MESVIAGEVGFAWKDESSSIDFGHLERTSKYRERYLQGYPPESSNNSQNTSLQSLLHSDDPTPSETTTVTETSKGDVPFIAPHSSKKNVKRRQGRINRRILERSDEEDEEEEEIDTQRHEITQVQGWYLTRSQVLSQDIEPASIDTETVVEGNKKRGKRITKKQIEDEYNTRERIENEKNEDKEDISEESEEGVFRNRSQTRRRSSRKEIEKYLTKIHKSNSTDSEVTLRGSKRIVQTSLISHTEMYKK